MNPRMKIVIGGEVMKWLVNVSLSSQKITTAD
jgi:hypothetical protein